MNRPRNTSAAVAPLPGSAHAAGLRYATDQRRGIIRRRAGTGFRYVGLNGRTINDAPTLKRIRALVIPPAWSDVWISPDPRAHLQATGRDARGRKQYRYHARWRDLRHQTKYNRMVPFARALGRIRRRVHSDLRQKALSKAKVVAAVVQLLEKTLIRVGNTEYARANGSFGLSTLRDGHVQVRGRALRFAFTGKSGIKQSVTLADARLARLVKRCQDLPGQALFQYLDETGHRRLVTSSDVNAYLREVAAADFTAKDFRTWAGTLAAAVAGRGRRAPGESRTTVTNVVEIVARHLGNTPAVCRACYIHPVVLEALADGTLARAMTGRHRARAGLSADEWAVLALLQGRRRWAERLAEAA
jgi:DNA topoisomerase-1